MGAFVAIAGPAGNANGFRRTGCIGTIDGVQCICFLEYQHVGDKMTRLSETTGMYSVQAGDKDEIHTGGKAHVLVHQLAGRLLCAK